MVFYWVKAGWNYYFNTVNKVRIIMQKVDSRSEQKGHALQWTCSARTWKCLSNYTEKKKVPFCFMVTQLLYVKSKAIQQPCLVPAKISCLSITLSAVSCDEGLTFSCSLPSFFSGFFWNEADGVIKTHMLRMKDLDSSGKWKLTWQPEMKMLYLVKGQSWQKRDFKHFNSYIIYTAV